MPSPDELVRSSRSGAPQLAPLPAERKWSLRLRPEHVEAASIAWNGSLNIAPLASSSVDGRHALRLGPDEWLLLADSPSATDGLRTLAESIALSLVDVSDRELAWEISGENADLVLATGCPLDFSDAAFPPGRATRTVYGHAEVVLWRPGPRRSWQIRALRSFATYLTHHLAHAGKQCAKA